MRRLSLGFIPIICLLLTGCMDSISPTSSFASSSNMERPIFTPTPAKTDIVRIQLNDTSLQDLLVEHDLAYPDPFSQEYPNVLTVPVMVNYSEKQLYYRSYEEMPFIGEKYPMTIPGEVHENLYKYDLTTFQKVKMGDVSLSGYSSGEFLFTDDAYYMFPATLEQGTATLHIKRLDFETGELQEITQIENGNIYVSSAQTENGTCAFLIRVTEGEQTSQRIYTLNEEKNLHIIYDSVQIGLKSPEFSALCAGNETLFLLRQIEREGHLVTEVVEMDLNGTVRRLISLPGLQKYSDPDYYADKLYVVGEYIFVKWFYCDEQLPYFSAFKLVDDKASKIQVPSNTPCYLLNQKPIDDRYFLFSAFPDEMDYTVNTYSSHLYVLDTMCDGFIGVHLPLAQDVVFNDMVCNENGDIIMNVVEKIEGQRTPQKRTIRIEFDELKSQL